MTQNILEVIFYNLGMTPVQFPSIRVFESSDTHVSLEVVGLHSTLNSGWAMERNTVGAPPLVCIIQ